MKSIDEEVHELLDDSEYDLDVQKIEKYIEPAKGAIMRTSRQMEGHRVEQNRNVMAHAQKSDLVFQRNRRVHLYRRGCQFSRVLACVEFGSAENDCIIVSKYVDHIENVATRQEEASKEEW